MQKSLLLVATVVLISPLSGCISVHERPPETISTTTTTRQTSLTPAGTATVERTTVY